ncbi:hypothetical protein MCP1_470013 [Candidatus Terasakiella magnetica]|nr:hypothetical protein MCP1_470013 [Candidatus Terasakiella magnetica]
MHLSHKLERWDLIMITIGHKLLAAPANRGKYKRTVARKKGECHVRSAVAAVEAAR